MIFQNKILGRRLIRLSGQGYLGGLEKHIVEKGRNAGREYLGAVQVFFVSTDVKIGLCLGMSIENSWQPILFKIGRLI